jgi:ACS family hexuronate transporter-like MFS transporter
VQLSGVAAPLIVVYVMADFGSIIGGWISSTMINRGFSVNAARKTAMLISCACIVPSAFTSMITGMWPAVFVMGMAVAGHQGFSSNLYTLVSDTFPRRAVGSVAGIGGFYGYLGYTFFGVLVGWILTVTHKNYLPVFLMCASAYLIAFAAIHLLMPRLQPVSIPEERQRGFDPLPPPPPGGIG